MDQERLKKQKRYVFGAFIFAFLIMMVWLFLWLLTVIMFQPSRWAFVFNVLILGGASVYYGYFAVRLFWVFFAYVGVRSKDMETDMVTFDCRNAAIVRNAKVIRWSPTEVVAVIFIAENGKRYFYVLVNDQDKKVNKVAIERGCVGRRISLKLYKGSRAAEKAYIGALSDV